MHTEKKLKKKKKTEESSGPGPGSSCFFVPVHVLELIKSKSGSFPGCLSNTFGSHSLALSLALSFSVQRQHLYSCLYYTVLFILQEGSTHGSKIAPKSPPAIFPANLDPGSKYHIEDRNSGRSFMDPSLPPKVQKKYTQACVRVQHVTNKSRTILRNVLSWLAQRQKAPAANVSFAPGQGLRAMGILETQPVTWSEVWSLPHLPSVGYLALCKTQSSSTSSQPFSCGMSIDTSFVSPFADETVKVARLTPGVRRSRRWIAMRVQQRAFRGKTGSMASISKMVDLPAPS